MNYRKPNKSKNVGNTETIKQGFWNVWTNEVKILNVTLTTIIG